jgi:membrane protease YdiL (CAAX protease family)
VIAPDTKSAASRHQERLRPARHRRVVFAVVLGVLFAVAKGAYIRAHDLDAPDTLLLQAALVLTAVTVGAVAGRNRFPTAAGLRFPRPWRSAAPPLLLASVVGLAAAVALSEAGPSEAARIVLVTALGEEILFRGVIYGLVVTVSTRAAVVVSSVTFGAWHVVDALEAAGTDAPMLGSLALVAGVVLVTSLAGALVFAPLRRRTGAVYAPALVHAALNLSGTLLVGL